ncbi:MAG TPA: hypothetical protein DCQ64_03335 [Candidatus Rokubacteria bacterium]|nr:hypothetical protein [Candidatus Rokubacteria bacterium]
MASITARRRSGCLGPALLVLEDFELVPIRPPGPEDLYDVINERHEKASIALTRSRPVGVAATLRLGTALVALDRLTHGARFVEIAGPSLRAEHTTHEPRSLRGVEVLTHPAPPFGRPDAFSVVDSWSTKRYPRGRRLRMMRRGAWSGGRRPETSLHLSDPCGTRFGPEAPGSRGVAPATGRVTRHVRRTERP